MKTLIITRHAKASWDNTDLPDFDRTILLKGIERTILICKAIKDANLIPDFILSSAAKRAEETTKLIAKELCISEKNIQTNKVFYLANINIWTEAISLTDNNIDRLMIVGHNPTLSYLANSFLPNKGINNIPTSGTVCIKFSCNNWKDISKQNAELIQFLI